MSIAVSQTTPPIVALKQRTVLFLEGKLSVHFLVQFFSDIVWVAITSNGRPGTVMLSSSAESAIAGVPFGGGGFIPDEALEDDAAERMGLGERLVDVDVLLGARDDPLVSILGAAISSAFTRFGFRQQVLLSVSLGRVGDDVPPEQRRDLVAGIVGTVISVAAQAMHPMQTRNSGD